VPFSGFWTVRSGDISQEYSQILYPYTPTAPMSPPAFNLWERNNMPRTQCRS
jgi:hypothetical protein